MKTLREVLVALRRGDRIPLEKARSQNGDTFVSKSLTFRKGQWIEWGINCWSSAAYGLGTCHCNSHSPDYEVVVSKTTALDSIRYYIQAYNQKEQDKINEIAWLDDLILQLESKTAKSSRG